MYTVNTHGHINLGSMFIPSILLEGSSFKHFSMLALVHSFPLEKRFYFNDAVLVLKIKHETTPPYLKDLVSQKAYFSNDTRFHLPTIKLDVFKMSFSFHGPKT